jgi:hypothetical protein
MMMSDAIIKWDNDEMLSLESEHTEMKRECMKWDNDDERKRYNETRIMKRDTKKGYIKQ